MEVTSLFGQWVPNFNFASVCFQPDILLSEAQIADCASESVNNNDNNNNNTDSDASNDELFENETVQEEDFENNQGATEAEDETESENVITAEESANDKKKTKLKRVRHSPEEYRCDSCPYTCTTERAFLKHCTSKKCGSADSCLSCPICGKDRASKEEINIHMQKHKKGKSYCCDICLSYKTVQLMKLIQHRRMHTGEKPHLCPYCNYRSSRRDNLRSHVKRVHKKTTLPGDTFTPRTVIITPSKCKQ